MDNIHSQSSMALYDSAIREGLKGLLFTLKQFLEKDIELERIVRVADLLLLSGANINNNIFQRILKKCLFDQKEDGGWISVEDTVWSVAFLRQFNEYSQKCDCGLLWIKQQQLTKGGWGRSSRDIGRIPLTGTLFFLLPNLLDKKGIDWLQNEWIKDSALNPKLTYKSAFFLMALKSASHKCFKFGFLDQTLGLLISEQNNDFGWGPWRGHPVGSSPFCTGVALVGLLQYPDLVDRQVIVNGLEWIRKKQLPNGLWPDHYIEEGSAWCFYALTEGYRFLKNHP
jgi:hypothetical protein